MPWRETPAELERARAEVPVVIPTPAGALYGIYTPPDPDAPPAGLCAVFFTRPRSHRNRMWVEGGRHLATLGFSAFRFDYHGVGDSEGESHHLNPNEPYRDDALAVLSHLRRQFNATRFVLTGMCFGGRTALSAFAAVGDAIAGLAFIAAPVMELDAVEKAHAARRSWKDVLRAMRSPRRWRELLDPRRLAQIGSVVWRMVWRRAMPLESEGLPLAGSFLEDFRAFERSRARALILYGEEDREYDSFRAVEASLLPRLRPAVRERIILEVWPGEVHGGHTQMTRQREVMSRILEWIRGFHPAKQAGLKGAA